MAHRQKPKSAMLAYLTGYFVGFAIFFCVLFFLYGNSITENFDVFLFLIGLAGVLSIVLMIVGSVGNAIAGRACRKRAESE